MTDKPCRGCRNHNPVTSDCLLREIGEDGYYHYPDGDCWKEKNLWTCAVCWPKLCSCEDRASDETD